MHHMDVDKTHREKDKWELYKNVARYLEQIHDATAYKAAAVRLLDSNHTSKKNKTCKVLLEKQERTQKHFFQMDSCT